MYIVKRRQHEGKQFVYLSWYEVVGWNWSEKQKEAERFDKEEARVWAGAARSWGDKTAHVVKLLPKTAPAKERYSLDDDEVYNAGMLAEREAIVNFLRETRQQVTYENVLWDCVRDTLSHTEKAIERGEQHGLPDAKCEGCTCSE